MADKARKANSKGGRLPSASMSTNSALTGGQAATATPKIAPTTGDTMACFTTLRAAASQRAHKRGEGGAEVRPDLGEPSVDASDDESPGFSRMHAPPAAPAPSTQPRSTSPGADCLRPASLTRVLAKSRGARSGSVARPRSAGSRNELAFEAKSWNKADGTADNLLAEARRKKLGGSDSARSVNLGCGGVAHQRSLGAVGPGLVSSGA